MRNKLIIAGIDPGTTSSYACLDSEGKVIKKRSAKELTLGQMLSEITAEGKVIAIGTDKRKTPFLIEKFSAKTGAMIIRPERDLSIKEKAELASDFAFDNEHERDSIASAMKAYRQLSPLIEKISKTVLGTENEKLKNEIILLVLKKRISINSAIEMLTRKERIEESIKPKSIEDSQIPDPAKEQMKMLERTNLTLKKHNNKLLNALKKAKSKIKKISFAPLEKARDSNIDAKRIDALWNKIREDEKEIRKAREKERMANLMLANIKGKVILKKLSNLSWDEYQGKNKALNIKEGDILLVEEPSNYSQRTIDEIKEKAIIIHRQQVGRKLKESLGMIFIFAAEEEFIESELFALAEKKQIEELKEKSDLLIRIIESYKKERMHL